jgi:hypothetical protein
MKRMVSDGRHGLQRANSWVTDDFDDPDADSDRGSMTANGRDARDMEDQMDEQVCREFSLTSSDSLIRTD